MKQKSQHKKKAASGQEAALTRNGRNGNNGGLNTRFASNHTTDQPALQALEYVDTQQFFDDLVADREKVEEHTLWKIRYRDAQTRFSTKVKDQRDAYLDYQYSMRKIEAERRAEREAERQAELEERHEAGSVEVPFLGTETVDPDHVEWKRQQFTNSKKWADYCRAHWPDLDAERQREIKLAENREERPQKCGEIRKTTLPNGEVVTRKWYCDSPLCDKCVKRNVWVYRRALNEIRGIAPQHATGRVLSPDELADWQPDDDPIQDGPPRENAPPLPQVKGGLSIIRIQGDETRLKLARSLRRKGIRSSTRPVTVDGQIYFDVIVNDDRGEPLETITDDRIELWIVGAEGKRSSGDILPSLSDLKKRYRKALPYEVVCPELDEEGEPLDPDIFGLELPDIGTSAVLPTVAVDFDVTDAETLQAALWQIHNEQWKILGRRGDVKYGVLVKKVFYTRYTTLPGLLAEFNARQRAIRQKKRRSED